jgi:hypothetical protein
VRRPVIISARRPKLYAAMPRAKSVFPCWVRAASRLLARDTSSYPPRYLAWRAFGDVAASQVNAASSPHLHLGHVRSYAQSNASAQQSARRILNDSPYQNEPGWANTSKDSPQSRAYNKEVRVFS